MTVHRTIVDGIVVLEPRADLVGSDAADRLHQGVRDEIAQGNRRLIIDMSRCRTMDSMGVGSLIGAQQACNESGCSLKLCGLTGRVAAPFEKFTRMGDLFSIHVSREEAIAAFGAPQG